MKFLFVKAGYHTAWGYKKLLRVVHSSRQGEENWDMGRDTLLARVIEKYIIGEKFLWTERRAPKVKYLGYRKTKLLKGLLASGQKYYALYDRVLHKKMSMEDLEAQIFWRVV